ncbi:MAG: encapsulin, partial [bacterium]
FGKPSVGLLDAAKTTIQVPFRNADELTFGENTYNAIIDAVAKLIAAGENGPYAGLFSFDTFADLNKSLPDRLDTPYDRAKEVLTAGIYSTGAMPRNTGLILSQGGHPFGLYVAKDFITAFNFIDQSGDHRFQICGRDALVIRVPEALVKLVFASPN